MIRSIWSCQPQQIAQPARIDEEPPKVRGGGSAVVRHSFGLGGFDDNEEFDTQALSSAGPRCVVSSLQRAFESRRRYLMQ